MCDFYWKNTGEIEETINFYLQNKGSITNDHNRYLIESVWLRDCITTIWWSTYMQLTDAIGLLTCKNLITGANRSTQTNRISNRCITKFMLTTDAFNFSFTFVTRVISPTRTGGNASILLFENNCTIITFYLAPPPRVIVICWAICDLDTKTPWYTVSSSSRDTTTANDRMGHRRLSWSKTP